MSDLHCTHCMILDDPAGSRINKRVQERDDWDDDEYIDERNADDEMMLTLRSVA